MTRVDDLAQCGHTGVEQCVLVKQIFIGISGETELREDRDRRVFPIGAFGQPDGAFRILDWIAEPDGRDTDREAHERVSINRLETVCGSYNVDSSDGRWWFARWREMLIGRMWRATMPQNPRPDRRNRVGRSNPACGSHQGACSLLFDALSRRNKRCAAGKPVAYSRVHPGRVGLPSNPMRTALTGRRTPQVAPTVSSLVHHGSPSADTRMGDVGDHPRADCLGNTRSIPSHSDWLIYSRANRWAVRGI